MAPWRGELGYQGTVALRVFFFALSDSPKSAQSRPSLTISILSSLHEHPGHLSDVSEDSGWSVTLQRGGGHPASHFLDMSNGSQEIHSRGLDPRTTAGKKAGNPAEYESFHSIASTSSRKKTRKQGGSGWSDINTFHSTLTIAR